MHQSGHWRAQSMQTVQLSSRRAMTPRALVGGASLTCGYWTVTAGRNIVLKVMLRPLSSPSVVSTALGCGLVRRRPFSAMDGHLCAPGPQDGGAEERHEKLRDAGLPPVPT